MDEASQKFLSVNTYLGLFKVKRLPFGVNASVSIFQRIISNVPKGLNGVCVYLDDILMNSRGEEQHLRNVDMVLERLKQTGLHANEKKCSFLKPSVEHLGHQVSADGLHPTSKKIRAVREAPEPTGKTELRSFLGFMNYYAKFLQNLSSTLSPLFNLTRKDVVWTWGKATRIAFRMAKEMLSNSQVMVHYDTDKPFIMECDASPCGIDAVLSHKLSDGTSRPVRLRLAV